MKSLRGLIILKQSVLIFMLKYLQNLFSRITLWSVFKYDSDDLFFQ